MRVDAHVHVWRLARSDYGWLAPTAKLAPIYRDFDLDDVRPCLRGAGGRAIVLVQEDQLSLAIGRRGQNVRLASKLVGWDIEIMTHDEYNDGIDRAENWFRALPGITDEMVEALIVEGFLSYTDLTFLDAAGLMEIIPVDEETGDEMIACAEEWAEEAEEQAR